MKRTLLGILLGLLLLAYPTADLFAQSTYFVDRRQKDDAAVDRNILFPTAETIGAGRVAVSDYDILLLGLTIGTTESSQFTVNFFLPGLLLNSFSAMGSIKLQVHRSERLLVAVQPLFGVVAGRHDNGFWFNGAVIVDYLVHPNGSVLLTGGAGLGYGTSDNEYEDESANLLHLHGGLQFRLGPYARFLTEVWFPATYLVDREEAGFVEEFVWFNWGLRLCGAHVALDITFIRPLTDELVESDGVQTVGFPWINLTGRWEKWGQH